MVILTFVISLASCRRQSTPLIVHFDAQNGQSIDSREFNDDFRMPSNPTREGYLFLGWFLSATDTQEAVDLNFIQENADLKELYLYAHWQEIDVSKREHTITLIDEKDDLNETYLVISGTYFDEPLGLELEAYAFLGWFTDHEGQTLFDFDKPITQDVTLYARYERLERLTITLINSLDDSKETLHVYFGRKITELTSPERLGYEFLGWYLDPQGLNQVDLNEPIKEALQIYSLWEELDPVTITLINTLDQGVTSQAIKIGDTIDEPIMHDKPGYRFIGWYHDVQGLEPVDFNSIVKEEFTMYALWRIVPIVMVDSLTFQDIPNVVYVNQVIDFSVTVLPNNADDKTYVVTSSHPNIVSVEDYRLTIRDKGIVTLSAISSDENTVTHWVLHIESVGVNNQEELNLLVQQGYQGEIHLLKNLENLLIEGPVKLNFNNYSIETLTIDTILSGAVVLKGSGSITKTLSIDAINMSVESSVTVIGNTDIKNVSYQSFVSEGTHQGLIRVYGRGRVHLSRSASPTPIHILTSERVILAGEMHGIVSLRHASAHVQVDGEIKHLEGREDAYVYVRRGSMVERIQTVKGHLKLALESESSVTIDASADVTKQDVVRIYTVGLSTSSVYGYELIEKGSKVTSINQNPTQSGHDFIGWFTDQAFEQSFNFNQNIEEDMTLYAQWQIHTFNVSFSGEHISIPTQVIDYRHRVSQPTTPQREGYRFVGWYQDIERTQAFSFSTRITEDVRLYGKWEILTYRIRYADLNIDDDFVDHGNLLVLPNDPEKEGHRFIGWFTDQARTELFSRFTPITEAYTLYPKFEPLSYEVRFITGVHDLSVDSKWVDFNTRIEQPVLSREFYVLEGWYLDDEFTQKFAFSQTIQEHTILYARWIENTNLSTYPVYFMNLDWPTRMVDRGTLLKVDLPTKEGHTFEGWYLDELYTDSFELTTAIERITTLYAKFSPNSHTVTFVTNVEGVTLTSIEGIYNQKIQAPELERFGYLLTGWYIGDDIWNFQEDKMPDQSITLTAIWEAINANIFVLEVDEEIGDEIIITLWLRGNVDLNSYYMSLDYDKAVLSYVSHELILNNHFVNQPEDGLVLMNYSNVLQKITSDQALIRFTFQRETWVETTLELTLLEGYVLDEQFNILTIEYHLESLTIE